MQLPLGQIVYFINLIYFKVLYAKISKSIPGNKQPKFWPVIFQKRLIWSMNEWMTVSGKFNSREKKPARKAKVRFTLIREFETDFVTLGILKRC